MSSPIHLKLPEHLEFSDSAFDEEEPPAPGGTKPDRVQAEILMLYSADTRFTEGINPGRVQEAIPVPHSSTTHSVRDAVEQAFLRISSHQHN